LNHQPGIFFIFSGRKSDFFGYDDMEGLIFLQSPKKFKIFHDAIIFIKSCQDLKNFSLDKQSLISPARKNPIELGKPGIIILSLIKKLFSFDHIILDRIIYDRFVQPAINVVIPVFIAIYIHFIVIFFFSHWRG